jgi:methylated-DNA-protein-cysteine methyltransferase related protein
VSSSRADLVLARLRSVPEGFVTTYGDLSPGAPRFAGAVLARTNADVPWQRVVRADGSLAKGSQQRRLLVAEGVPFSGPRVDMREALFPPEELIPGSSA